MSLLGGLHDLDRLSRDLHTNEENGEASIPLLCGAKEGEETHVPLGILRDKLFDFAAQITLQRIKISKHS